MDPQGPYSFRTRLHLIEALRELTSRPEGATATQLIERLRTRLGLEARDLALNSSGGERWATAVRFYAINLEKAGFIVRREGVWFVTPEGVRAAAEWDPSDFWRYINKAYRAAREPTVTTALSGEALPQGQIAAEPGEENGEPSLFDTVVEKARVEIIKTIREMTPYAFQDLVAALLRGMGYSTPFIAPPGPDGGTDILAYRDALGATKPHVRVQVKHRADRARPEEVRALIGVIKPDREIGMFVSSGGFTDAAQNAARHGTVHIEMMDIDRIAGLWIENYERLSEADRAMLPLRKLYVVAPPG